MRFVFLIIFTGLFFYLPADNAYHYAVNLTQVNNDKVSVSLTPPDLTQHEVEFAFPAMVPGTYEVYDFGRFISNFKVTGINGSTNTVKRSDVNIEVN
jgi:predicted metalloprotease with PDZ domain